MALRGLALSSWLSGCGLLLLLREIKVPFVRQFLRRHARFATTASGRSTMHLFAATLALSSGSTASALIGLATLANFAFGRHVRKEMKEYYRATAPPPIIPPMVAPPEEVEEEVEEVEVEVEPEVDEPTMRVEVDADGRTDDDFASADGEEEVG